MNLLFVSADMPEPVRKGYQIVASERLRHLQREHRITLLAITPRAADLSELERLREFCLGGVHVCTVGRARSLYNLLRCAVDGRESFQEQLYKSPEAKALALELVERNRIDAIYAVMGRVWPVLPRGSVPLVMDLVDSMQHNYRSRIPSMGVLQRFVYRSELRRVTRLENQIVAEAQRVWLVSGQDNQWRQNPKVCIAPLGVRTDLFQPQEAPLKSELIFTGNMAYGPNQEAVGFFVRECLPLLRRKHPFVRLQIAGRDAQKYCASHAREAGVLITSNVAQMADALNSAQISLAPMRSGSGMQNKVLEAMACGLAVVCTRKGLGDIHAIDGQQVLLAESPEEFVCAISRLLENDTLRRSIGASGRARVQAEHSWEAVNSRVEADLKSIVAATHVVAAMEKR